MSNAPTPLPTAGSEAGSPDDFRAMLLGAAVVFVISFISFIPFIRMACCLPHLVAALLAVHWFTREYSLTLSYAKGIKLGIFTCLLGGFCAWAVSMLIWLVFDHQLGAKEGQALGLWIAEKAGGPEAVKQARQAMDAQQAQGITLGQVLIGIVAVATISSVSGLIGGALGTVLFRRGPKPAEGQG